MSKRGLRCESIHPWPDRYCDVSGLCHYWLYLWLTVRWHQAIIWTNVKLLSMESCNIHFMSRQFHMNHSIHQTIYLVWKLLWVWGLWDSGLNTIVWVLEHDWCTNMWCLLVILIVMWGLVEPCIKTTLTIFTKSVICIKGSMVENEITFWKYIHVFVG